ncbi:MAG: putative lipid II flippase FtsW [Candidatus Moraniibacteriota bacterium]
MKFFRKTRAISSSQGEFDSQLLTAVLILVGVGLLTIASAGVFYSQTRFGSPYYFLNRQFLFGIIPGMFALWFFSRIDYHFWRRFSVVFFGLTVLCLILIFIPGLGTKVYGASRWLAIGPFSFQPSEMAKLSIILYLSAWLAKQGKKQVGDFYEGFIPFLVILGVLGFLVIKQPDTGTLGLILCISLGIFFVAGARMTHIALIVSGAIGFLGVLIALAPYRMQRMLVFLNPEHDSQGVGYQVTQALIAVGSGGFFGAGLGQSRQKFNYLPEPVTDSIFAVFSEEWGFFGAMVLIGLFTWLIIRGINVARTAPDDFGRLIATGVTVWIFAQTFINIMAITGLIPLTGVPLPFMSYGGTSLVFLLAGVGLMLNISRQSSQ